MAQCCDVKVGGAADEFSARPLPHMNRDQGGLTSEALLSQLG